MNSLNFYATCFQVDGQNSLPASASIPTLLIAVARPKISGAVSPASLPPAAKRLVISTISFSVVAKLFICYRKGFLSSTSYGFP
nr:MAG TPA: hypothetical protein [Caudoviricetes sp.]